MKQRRSRMVILVASALLCCTCFGQSASAATPASKFEECDRHIPDAPSLNHAVFPGATFAVVDQVVGAEGAVPLKQKIGRERLRLSPSVDLTVLQWGCEDYVLTYEFRLSEAPPANTDQAYWLQRAAQLIGQVAPGNIDPAIDLKRLREALLRRAAGSHGQPMPAMGLEGDLDTTGFGTGYDLTLKRTPKASYLTVGYWVGL